MIARFRLLPSTILGDCEWPGAPERIILPANRVTDTPSGASMGISLAFVLFSRTGIAELPDGSRCALYDTSDRRAKRCTIAPPPEP